MAECLVQAGRFRAAGDIEDLAAGKGRVVKCCPLIEESLGTLPFERENVPPGVRLDGQALVDWSALDACNEHSRAP